MKTKPKWGLGFAGVSLVSTIAALNADVPAEKDEILDLPGVTVVASRIALPVGTVGSSVTTLDLEDLARFETELASDVIRHIEGVYLRNNGNSGSAAGISMRGLPIAPVVLIDGVEVNDPGSGTVFNFGNLPMSSISSIEVLRGAQSALYGANALTGVISITTKQGVSMEPEMVIGASYGSRDSVRSYATLSQSTETLNYFFTATFEDSDGYSVQDPTWGDEWADDDLYRNKSLIGKVNFSLTDVLKISVFGSYQDAKSEYDPGTPSVWTIPIYDNYLNTEQLLLKSELSAEFSDAWNSSLAVSFNDFSTYAVDNFGIRDNESEMIKFDFLNAIQFADWFETVAGLEYEDAKDRIGDYSMDTFAVYLENIISVNEKIHTTLGIRLDDNSAFGSEVTWRSSFSYAISEVTRLKGSYGVSYDAPEISELFGTWGNPDLEAERGYNYDLGLEHGFRANLKAGLTFFHIGIDDHIEYLRSTSTYANVDWKSTGLETYIDWNAMEALFVRIAYTWTDAKRTGVDDELLFHSPDHILSAMFDYSMLNDRWNHSITFQYVGERETWSGPTDAFTVIDFSSRFQLTPATEIWIRVENLLDETYEEILDYRSPGLGVFAGVKVEF